MSASLGRLNLRVFAANQPLALALLTTLAIVLFVFVTAVSRLYTAQQQALADRWSSRGVVDLGDQRFPAAVADFRTALLYSRDDSDYELRLAQALMGEKKFDEAEAYLTSLWERHPEDGEVNLELARIAGSQNENERAIRYYHNAVYAAWPADREHERREARYELIDLLLREHAYPQAQSELIALAANVGDDAAERARVGELFLAAQDNEHALEAFRLSLRGNPHDQAALAGAGRAAFELGRYPEAVRYLREAVEASGGNSASAGLLSLAEDVVEMNPFRDGITASERDNAVMEDFAAAGARLDACAAAGGPAQGAALQGLHQAWNNLKPQVTARGLREDPDLAQTAMSLVFNIEHETATLCGAARETDTALQLIANMREGS